MIALSQDAFDQARQRPPHHAADPAAAGAGAVDQGWDRGFLDEEAYQWVRDPALLSDEECLLPWAVGIDVKTEFLAAASRLTVGLSEPEHVAAPAFDKKIPGIRPARTPARPAPPALAARGRSGPFLPPDLPSCALSERSGDCY
ncbi:MULTISPECIES: hypothetical protein [unclassified Streptomyces]|uniref:Uncharacterized protein n=1 Tax=Streptomyces thermocoprophilus TaxID=78356 RepID=A0ABV5VKE4_9ACTN